MRVSLPCPVPSAVLFGHAAGGDHMWPHAAGLPDPLDTSGQMPCMCLALQVFVSESCMTQSLFFAMRSLAAASGDIVHTCGVKGTMTSSCRQGFD